MKLESLLSTQGLVEQAPNPDDIRARGESGEPIDIFYGETFDEAGTPIDSLKYYLFVAELSDALRAEGYPTNPTILVADTAVSRNVATEKQAQYRHHGDDRFDVVSYLDEVYGTGLKIARMSHFIDDPNFVAKREEIMEFCQNHPELMIEVEKTVPESKLEVEREKGFMYSFDELATIMDLDLKVGPPREDLYDEVARTIATAEGQDPLMSLYLRPTFPLGMNWSYFFKNEGIEDHGITAYKAASKRLQSHRIILGRSAMGHVEYLFDNTFMSTNPDLPNPVLDIGIIAEFARKRIEKDDGEIDLAQRYYGREISDAELKEEVLGNLSKFVMAYF